VGIATLMQNFSIAIYFLYSEGNASCIAMRPEWKVSSLLEEGRVLLLVV